MSQSEEEQGAAEIANVNANVQMLLVRFFGSTETTFPGATTPLLSVLPSLPTPNLYSSPLWLGGPGHTVHITLLQAGYLQPNLQS